MSKNRQKIREGLRELVDFGAYEIYGATVSTVDEAATTIDVLINDDLIIPDVRLRSNIDTDDGMYVIPAVDSFVLIGKIDGGVDYFLIKASVIDKVIIKIGAMTMLASEDGFVFNEGNNDGLVKIQKLTTKLNDLENQVNDILTALQGITVPLAPSGTYPLAPAFASIIPLVTTQQTDIENTDVKH